MRKLPRIRLVRHPSIVPDLTPFARPTSNAEFEIYIAEPESARNTGPKCAKKMNIATVYK